MPPALPKAIILDITPEYRHFMQEAAMHWENKKYLPSYFVDEVWEAIYDLDTRDEKLWEIMALINHNKKSLWNAAYSLAKVLYDKVDEHDLYKGRGYIPFNMEVKNGGIAVMKIDNELEATQQEWLRQEGMEDLESEDEDDEDEDPADLEWM